MSLFPIDRVMPLAVRAAKKRGVHLALVVDNKDPDSGTLGYRVRVTYPWMTDRETSYWARIVVPMAGPERGTYFLPEVDDQVLVVFEHGDINRPIVIGALWSKKQTPVEVNDSGKNNTKLIKSRSGHRIIFSDEQGAEKVTIVDKTRKNKIVLDAANKVVKIECAGDVEIKAADNVIVHANSLKVGTSQTFTGEGKSVLTHAQSSFGVKASANITVGGASVKINQDSGAACSVSGSGSGELGGIAAETVKDQIEERTRSDGGAGGGRAPAAGGGAGPGGGGAGPGGGGAGPGGGGGPSPGTPSPTTSPGTQPVDGGRRSATAGADNRSVGPRQGGASSSTSPSTQPGGGRASATAGADNQSVGSRQGGGRGAAGASGSSGAGASGTAGAGARGSVGAGASVGGMAGASGAATSTSTSTSTGTNLGGSAGGASGGANVGGAGGASAGGGASVGAGAGGRAAGAAAATGGLGGGDAGATGGLGGGGRAGAGATGGLGGGAGAGAGATGGLGGGTGATGGLGGGTGAGATGTTPTGVGGVTGVAPQPGSAGVDTGGASGIGGAGVGGASGVGGAGVGGRGDVGGVGGVGGASGVGGAGVGGAGDVGDVAGVGGAGSVGAAGSVGGAGSVGAAGSVGGVGGVGGAGGAGVPRGVHSVGGFASGGAAGSANLNLPQGSPTRNLEHGVSDATDGARSVHVEAAANREMGADARSAMRGGAGEEHVMAGVREADVRARAQAEIRGEALGQRNVGDDLREGALEDSGYRDPEAELGRAERLEFHARDQQLGRLRTAESRASGARQVMNDPATAAKTEAADLGMQEVKERAPGAVDVQADVDVASRTIQDPATAGEAKIQGTVDAKVRGTTSGTDLKDPEK